MFESAVESATEDIGGQTMADKKHEVLPADMECGPFLFKPFVHSPDSVIKAEGTKNDAKWADRWGRKCGNPLYQKRPTKLAE